MAESVGRVSPAAGIEEANRGARSPTCQAGCRRAGHCGVIGSAPAAVSIDNRNMRVTLRRCAPLLFALLVGARGLLVPAQAAVRPPALQYTLSVLPNGM